jgi:hypothetical protein
VTLKFKQKTFGILVILIGTCSFYSWARSPAVNPVMEIPHYFPTQSSPGNISGYDLSKNILKQPIHNYQKGEFAVSSFSFADIIGLIILNTLIFGPIGFFYFRKDEITEVVLTEIEDFPKKMKPSQPVKKAS